MQTWIGGLAALVLFTTLTTLLQPIVLKLRRRGDRSRCGELDLVYEPTKTKPTFEIVAVPGLGADPNHTWTARSNGQGLRHAEGRQCPNIHLLRDLLPSSFPDARIWNFDHNSDWLVDAPLKTTEEIGKSLLYTLKDKLKNSGLPIIFIGHSLGGIIIKQALRFQESQDVMDRTSGVIFLGTPHQGSSLSILATFLATIFWFAGSDTTLTLSLKAHSAQLTNLADVFETRIRPRKLLLQRKFIVAFYEKKPTYLFGWLPLQLVVTQDSAVSHADEQISAETDHSALNKFNGPKDRLYERLTKTVDELKAPSLLRQADEMIRNYYEKGRLKIERLSGATLSPQNCYINLTIVEQSKTTAKLPVSLLAREKLEYSDNDNNIELQALFDERQRTTGSVRPNRILIRGRAGVGKTTLCKKIVHEYYQGSWKNWNKLFDRILWIPLRHLKQEARLSEPGYNFKHLFEHEFFSLPISRPELAQTMFAALESEQSRTLFLLDGLDEISRDLRKEDDMSKFLNVLLNQPSVIITSRPGAQLPSNLKAVDLELETVGFHPDQVQDYLIAEGKTNLHTESIESFLESHPLMQGLVRIPIQLDAICYTWDQFAHETQPTTMTGVYKAMEKKIWAKDVVKLGKRYRGAKLTDSQISDGDVEHLAQPEIIFLESLAFSGMHDNMFDFTSQYIGRVNQELVHQDLLPVDTLRRLSFVRASDSSPTAENCYFHFIHLTYQEYFAARYFVRGWTKNELLQVLSPRQQKGNSSTDQRRGISPRDFVRKEKYNIRYDIFWRFVAGLLDTPEQEKLIESIEEEPLDLLGLTHQRLIVHCLNEITGNLPSRQKLEAKLAKWLMLQIHLRCGDEEPVSEYPDSVLQSALSSADVDGKKWILYTVNFRENWSEALAEAVGLLLEIPSLTSDVADILKLRSSLPTRLLKVLKSFLVDGSELLRQKAWEILAEQTNLPDALLLDLIAYQEEGYVSGDCYTILEDQTTLSDPVVMALMNSFRTNSDDVAMVLRQQKSLPIESITRLMIIVHNKGEELDVRKDALRALSGLARKGLPDEAMNALLTVAQDKGETFDLRKGALHAFYGLSSLPDEAMNALLTVAQDKGETFELRKGALHAFYGLSSLPDEAVAELLAVVTDEGENLFVRKTALSALNSLSNPSSIATLMTLVGCERTSVRSAELNHVGERETLPEMFDVLLKLLSHESWAVCACAIHTLMNWKNLPEEIITALTALLTHERLSIRCDAARALVKSKLPDATVMALEDLLKDVTSSTRLVKIAISALSRQVTLPNTAIITLAFFMVKSEASSKLLHCVSDALVTQRCFPEAATEILTTALREQHETILELHITRALACCSNLPDVAMHALATVISKPSDRDTRSEASSDILQDPRDQKWWKPRCWIEHLRDLKSYVAVDSSPPAYVFGPGFIPSYVHPSTADLAKHKYRLNARLIASIALSHCKSLPADIIAALASKLSRKYGSDVRSIAAIALSGCSRIPPTTWQDLTKLGKSKNNYVRESFEMLFRQELFPDLVVLALVKYTKHRNENVRYTAYCILRRLSRLPDTAERALMRLLKNRKAVVQGYALRVLHSQFHLSHGSVVFLKDLLRNADRTMRHEAARLLINQSSLPDSELVALTRILENDELDNPPHMFWYLWDKLDKFIPLLGFSRTNDPAGQMTDISDKVELLQTGFNVMFDLSLSGEHLSFYVESDHGLVAGRHVWTYIINQGDERYFMHVWDPNLHDKFCTAIRNSRRTWKKWGVDLCDDNVEKDDGP